MKYFSQKDFGACGAVALANALVWAEAPRPDLKKIDWHCRRGVIIGGTPTERITEVLRKNKESLRYKRKNRPTFGDIREHLHAGGAALLQFCWPNSHTGHYCLIIGLADALDKKLGVNSVGFVVINWEEGKALKRIIVKRRIDNVLNIKRYGAPRVWLLSKKVWAP